LGWLIFAGVAAVGGTTFLFVPSMNGAYVKPDQAQMRAYRVSKLTDGQLIALHEKSVVSAGRSSRRRETRPPEHGEVRLGSIQPIGLGRAGLAANFDRLCSHPDGVRGGLNSLLCLV